MSQLALQEPSAEGEPSLSARREDKGPSFAQILFLSLGMPLLLLLAIEGLCRVLGAERWFEPAKTALELEMPAWMQQEDNTRLKNTRLTMSREDVEWFDMFEPAPGFRVRLLPNITRSVTNTFSRLQADKSKKYLIEANALGFRGPNVTQAKAPGTFRVLVFGDSSSFGWGVSQGDEYARVLESLLRAKYPGRQIEVLNFAIPGDSSEYGRLIFDEFASSYQPDYVIVGFGANDAKNVVVPHQAQVDRFRAAGSIQRTRAVLEASALFRTMQKALALLTKKTQAQNLKPAKTHAVPQKRYQENLSYMGEQSLKYGAKGVLLLSLCTPSSYAKSARRAAHHKRFAYLNGQKYLIKAIPALAGKKLAAAQVAQMEREFGDELKRNRYFYVTSDACHPNTLGQRLVGEKILQTMAAQRVLP